MDENLKREIDYLTRLIENHKKRSLDKLYCKEKVVTSQRINQTNMDKCTNLFHKSQLCRMSNNTSLNEVISTNVYINPNFKHQSSTIHINRKLHPKPLVHVNPKMMQSVISSKEKEQPDSANVIPTTDLTSVTNTKQNFIQKSVHINPKLMKKLSSTVSPQPVEHKEIMQNQTQPICSRLKLIKSTNSTKVVYSQKKLNNSNIIILSRRKLVRVRKGSKKSLNGSQIELCKIKRAPDALIKNIKSPPQRIMKTKIINSSQISIGKNISFIRSSIVKPKINKYRIDRTVSKATSTREHTGLGQEKSVNNKVELITIGGIVYKSSKNHLVRRSYGVKKKRAINFKADKFIIATNGKKLCRVKSLKEAYGGSSTKILNTVNTNKLVSNMSQKVNYKNNISNKVKQKSIQILRNKMQKNNQPCLIFQKFGYCSNHEKGTCVKRHDKKQVSLCKMFLQGNCLLDNCPLSHDVGPEKMPTCKYFLEGCCTRDSCPYRHIKVSSRTPICIEFLQGYCAKGSECKQRHENLCPEFEKTKKCGKGKHCPYPHKSQSSSNKSNRLKRKYNIPNNHVRPPVTKDISSPNTENRLRYYEQTDALSKSFDKKRETIMKKVKLMKRIESITRSNPSVEPSDSSANSLAEPDSDESESISDPKVLKRPPIGVLPAYIPIG